MPADAEETTLHRAVAVIQQGGLIAYPTEAVWGLGCDPWHQQAVCRLLTVKARPLAKGLILVGATDAQFAPLLAPLSAAERTRLTNSWPGPHTWLLPDPTRWAPPWIRGQFATVAVRVSAHPIVRKLCRLAGKPLVSTSANRTGQCPLRTLAQVERAFTEYVDVIVPGATGRQQHPSAIRDVRTNQVMRTA